MRSASWFILIALWNLLCIDSLHAQTQSEKEERKDIESLEFRVGTVEDIVDPKEYLIGPGDQMVVSIWGQVSRSLISVVSPEGAIIIPSVAEIDVRGLSLLEAKEKIKKEVSRVYVNADISVNLMTPRTFKVNVTGASVKKSSVDVTAMDRVSWVVKQVVDSKDSLMSQRNIRIVRKTGEILRVDMVRRNQSGTLATDPRMTNGDFVSIPARAAEFFVYGPVAYPGAYEFVPGERLLDIIELCGGLKHSIDSSHVEIVSFIRDTSRTFRLRSLDLAAAYRNLADTNFNPVVSADDRIYFKEKANFRQKANVEVMGEVNVPGVYPIMDRQTRLSEIILKAGGLTRDASLENVLISRLAKDAGTPDREFERLKLTPLVEMTEIERSYFKSKTRSLNPNVQTDFVRLFSDAKIQSTFDVTLQDEDHIFVGRTRQTVTVLGGVVLPGLFDLNAGSDYRFYVEKAGGFAKKARRGDIKIIKSATKQWLDADEDVDIQDGDVIFVPEKEPLDGWKIFRETLATLGQIAAITSTVILIYFTVR